jgi:hypothetical protein
MSYQQPDINLQLIHQKYWPKSKQYYKASVTEGKCSVGYCEIDSL